MDGEDWDLAAIVRSCCSSKRKQQQDRGIAAADSPPAVEMQIGDQLKREEMFLGFVGGNLERKPSSMDEGLQVLCNPYLLKRAAFKNRAEGAAASASQSGSRTKKRKKQLKKVVCQVPADGVSSDVWSWRKYGQKPIKGSPFPRGYYRCSTIRGCPARKQVERDRTNPGQLIITYTSEHNHPMPAHHKLPATSPSERKETEDKIPTSPATSLSLNNEDQEKEQEEEEEMLMVEDMEVIGSDELIFVGNNSSESLFDDDDDVGGGVFGDWIIASPWLEKSGGSNATAAAC